MANSELSIPILTKDLETAMHNCELSIPILTKDLDAVKRLLSRKQCSPNGDRSDRDPPIIECVGRGDGQGDTDDARRCGILEVLVTKGANLNTVSLKDEYGIDIGGKTAAIYAAGRGSLRCLRLLVESGADLCIECRRGLTALSFAVLQKRTDCVRYLADIAPARVLNHTDRNGRTALMLAANTSGKKSVTCMRHLIAAGARLDVEDNKGYTALMLALINGNAAAVALLLESGSPVNTVLHDGSTALSLSFQNINGNYSNVLKLLTLGADPTQTRDGRHYLHVMVAKNQKAVVRRLVMSGFPPILIESRSLSGLPLGLQQQTKLSPLAVAVICKLPHVSRYFINNHFLTRFDLVHLGRDSCVRQCLQETGSSNVSDRTEKGEALRRQCLEILDFLSSTPQSLLSLSLMAVSSALIHDLNPDTDNGVYTQGTTNTWLFRQIFRGRVDGLNLPPKLKRQLTFQTPSSKACCMTWGSIRLEKVRYFEHSKACYCVDCEGIDCGLLRHVA